MINQIKFTHNWNNKLDLDIFTTIRKWTKEKEEYYKSCIAYNFRILFRGKILGNAELQEVEVFEFSDIPKGLIMYDTGLDHEKAHQVFGEFGLVALPNNKAIILTFKNIRNSDVGDKRNGN